MDKFYRNETITLTFNYKDGDGVLTDPDTYKIAIDDPAGEKVVADTTDLSKSDTGIYYYAYAPGDTAKLGIYRAQAIMTKSGDINRQGTKRFELLEEVGQ